jgi:hypothetical protein
MQSDTVAHTPLLTLALMMVNRRDVHVVRGGRPRAQSLERLGDGSVRHRRYPARNAFEGLQAYIHLMCLSRMRPHRRLPTFMVVYGMVC